MTTRFVIIVITLLISINVFGQKTYKDSLVRYQKKYVSEHEIVKGKDKDLISFYPLNKKYKVECSFERTLNMPWFRMESSGPIKKNYRVYGIIHFKINDTTVSLNIYQSQDLMVTKEYKDHLFIPFTDLTTGEGSYESGRYIDLEINDIKNNSVVLDFNKAYNPYCAYVAGKFNCPIPPAENNLSIAILAGEKTYGKSH